jgi:deazaflavin-dependent oxidoreductase (nitroreductase family)
MALTYRLGTWRRAVNAVVRAFLRAGLAPPRTYLLTVTGRRTGRTYATPVTLVEDGRDRWLVAPYGEVAWVRNARAAGRVTLGRGRRAETLDAVEVRPEVAGPVLKRYATEVPVTRPFFDARWNAPVAAFVAEAARHPVFRLVPRRAGGRGSRPARKGGRSMAIVELADARIALDDVGAGDPVLLLHGFPVTRALWAGVAPRLAEAGHRVLAPDLVGYGESEPAPGLGVGMASQARWMLELLDRLGIARAAVVAHDVGTAAAQLMLVRAPERIRALVLMDGVHGREWAMEAVASIQAWDPQQASRLAPVLVRRLGRPLRGLLAVYEGEEGGRRLIRAARDLDPGETAGLQDALAARRVPALVLWGDRDPFFPVDTVARPLAELLGADLRVLPGGHFLPLDAAEAVSAELCAFLGRATGGPGALRP